MIEIAREHRLADVMYDTLRREIVSGQLRPGARLVERDLALRHDVSRIPVREAMQRLANDGLIDVTPTGRATVHRYSPEEIDDLHLLRETLEGVAARLAARRRPAAQLAELRALHDSYTRDFTEGDPERALAKTGLWHHVLLTAAGSPALTATMRPIEQRVQWALLRHTETSILLAEHEAILTAIESGDEDVAEQLVRHHTRSGQRIVLAGLDA